MRLERLLDDRGTLAIVIGDDGRWITLRNHKRIKIDEDGRILAGLPERFHGTRIELAPPEPLIQLQAARLSVEECEADVDRRLAALFDQARAGELAAPEGGDDAPF